MWDMVSVVSTTKLLFLLWATVCGVWTANATAGLPDEDDVFSQCNHNGYMAGFQLTDSKISLCHLVTGVTVALPIIIIVVNPFFTFLFAETPPWISVWQPEHGVAHSFAATDLQPLFSATETQRQTVVGWCPALVLSLGRSRSGVIVVIVGQQWACMCVIVVVIYPLLPPLVPCPTPVILLKYRY